MTQPVIPTLGMFKAIDDALQALYNEVSYNSEAHIDWNNRRVVFAPWAMYARPDDVGNIVWDVFSTINDKELAHGVSMRDLVHTIKVLA